MPKQKFSRTLMLVLASVLILGTVVCGSQNASDAPSAPATVEEEAATAPTGKDAAEPAAAETAESTTAAEPAANDTEEVIEVREATTVMAATQMINLRDLPLPDEAELIGPPEAGSLRYQAPIEVAEAADLYRSALADQGWQENAELGYADDTTVSTFFTKADFTLSLSISGMDANNTMVSLINHGNIDLRALPKMADADATTLYYSPSSLNYFSPTDVAGVADFTRRELAAQGWREYTRPNTAMADDPEREQLTLIQNGLELSVSIGVAPAQEGKTGVQYSITLLPLDLPMPADVADLEFDKTTFYLSYTTPADFETLFDFYRQAMTNLGWVVIDSIGMMTPERATLFFGNENVPPFTLVLDLIPSGGQTSATLRNYEVDEITELSTPPETSSLTEEVEETPTETEGPQMVGNAGEEIPDFLIPADAQDVVYDADFGDITYTSPSDVETVVEFYRRSLLAEGWQEDEDVAEVDEDFAFIGFDQDEDSIFVDITPSTDITEVTIDVSFASSLVEILEGETSTGGAASDSGPLSLVEEYETLVPSDYTSLYSESSQFSKMVTLTSPSDIDTLVELYETELPTRGWEYMSDSITNEATLYFAGGGEELVIHLWPADGETGAEVTVRDPAAAAEAGILPTSGQGRIYLGNMLEEGDAIVTIDGQKITVPPSDPMIDSPDQLQNVDLSPGTYNITATIPDLDEVSEEIDLGADTVWVLMIGPGGLWPLRVY